MIGKIHSLESFGTVDGPGIRFVIFVKGCPMRCLYCHNPDTWYMDNATLMSEDEIIKKAMKYRGYWGDKGGITISGGEPLLQFDFVLSLLKKFKELNVNTCVDTSGITFNLDEKDKYLELIKYVDLFLLDIKHINNEEHKKLTTKPNINVLEFANFLNENNKNVWIRHVLVPGITTNELYLKELKRFVDTLNNVSKIEVLPYHTLGIHKYENLGIPYKLKGINPPTKNEILLAKEILGITK